MGAVESSELLEIDQDELQHPPGQTQSSPPTFRKQSYLSDPPLRASTGTIPYGTSSAPLPVTITMTLPSNTTIHTPPAVPVPVILTTPPSSLNVEDLFQEMQESCCFTKEEFTNFYHTFNSIYELGELSRDLFIGENLFRGRTPRFWGRVCDLLDYHSRDGKIDFKDFIESKTKLQTIKKHELWTYTFKVYAGSEEIITKETLVEELTWLFSANRTLYLAVCDLLSLEKPGVCFYSKEEDTKRRIASEKFFELLDKEKTGKLSKQVFLEACSKNKEHRRILIAETAFLDLERNSRVLALTQFTHQVAGHKKVQKKGGMLKSVGKFFKPLSKAEYRFYEQVYVHSACPELLPFLPRFFGRTYVNEVPSSVLNYLILEDLTEGYEHPVICDVKMGTQGHGDDASLQKTIQQILLCVTTTSAQLGFRICGMKVWQPDSGTYQEHSTFWGAMLNELRIVDAFKAFFTGRQNSLRKDALTDIYDQLVELLEWFKVQTTFRFYSSSILLIFEGSDNLPSKAKIRMVDFAHTFKNEEDSKIRDESYLIGLQNLVTTLKEVMDPSTWTPEGSSNGEHHQPHHSSLNQLPEQMEDAALLQEEELLHNYKQRYYYQILRQKEQHKQQQLRLEQEEEEESSPPPVVAGLMVDFPGPGRLSPYYYHPDKGPALALTGSKSPPPSPPNSPPLSPAHHHHGRRRSSTPNALSLAMEGMVPTLGDLALKPSTSPTIVTAVVEEQQISSP